MAARRKSRSPRRFWPAERLDRSTGRPASLAVSALPIGTAPYIELFSLACEALAGCQACMQSHEAAVVHGGLSEDHVHETVRIAAVVQGFLVALGLG